MNENKIAKAKECLGLKFLNKKLLKQALTHPSFSLEGGEEYERLEFLGDAILAFVVTDFIFRRFPQFDQGLLTKLRANLVNTEVLAEVAERIKLGEYLFTAPGVLSKEGRERTSILGNSFEALLGALYLDQGLQVVKEFVLKTLQKDLFEQARREEFSDFKSALQEDVVEKMGILPEYEIVKESGPVHEKVFYAQVKIEGKVWGKGKGRSKKKAELAAAKQALRFLKKLKI